MTPGDVRTLVNSLVAAEDMEGINGSRVFAIPHERLRAVLRKVNPTKAVGVAARAASDRRSQPFATSGKSPGAILELHPVVALSSVYVRRNKLSGTFRRRT